MAEEAEQNAHDVLALVKLNIEHKVNLVDGDDRPGALADLTDRLGSAGINMTAVTGLCAGQGRFGAILWVKPGDVKKAAKVFGIGLT